MYLYNRKYDISSRSVLLLIRALALDVEKIYLNDDNELSRRDYERIAFFLPDPYTEAIKMVKVCLITGDRTIFESSAILKYLGTVHGAGSGIYPSGFIGRTRQESVAMFIGRMSMKLELFLVSVASLVPPSKESLAGLEEAFILLEGAMGEQPYMAGESITVADFDCIAHVSSLIACGISSARFPKLNSWIRRCEENMSGYQEINQYGASALGITYQEYIKKFYL